MSHKMEGHSKKNVTENEILLKKKFVTQNGMSPRKECRLKWNVTQNEMSLKFECHTN